MSRREDVEDGGEFYVSVSRSQSEDSQQMATYVYRTSPGHGGEAHGSPNASVCTAVSISAPVKHSYKGSECEGGWQKWDQECPPRALICSKCDQVTALECEVAEDAQAWKRLDSTGKPETLFQYEDRIREAVCAIFKNLEANLCTFEEHWPSTVIST